MVKLKGIIGYASIGMICLFIVFSNEAASSALNGMRLCRKVLIPTLFPMMVLTGIAVRSGVFGFLGRVGNKIFKPLFGIDGKYIISLAIGILGSAPTGAMAVKSLSSASENKDEAASALLLSSVVSFGFIYSVIGINYLDNLRRGVILFLFQIISVMIVASLLRPKKMPVFNREPSRAMPEKISAAVASSIRDASVNMLSVCGSVIFFSSLSGILLLLPVGESAKLFLCPFLELASGLEYISGRFSQDVTFILASCAVGWSGLSMIFQTLSVAGGEISPHKYIIGRCASALICTLLAVIGIRFGII